ncbi:MAG TPA: lyase family protein [Phycisphaerales bacterium]|nr:lyase family protein [Phycisphaerales bacterium]
MTSPYDTYTSPLATRNASPEMLRLWSARHKFNTWRRIWLAVAEAQHELTNRGSGASPSTAAPLVAKEQVEELRAVVNRPGGITDDEIRLAEKYERELRHDVMAHVHALGDSCPKAKGIIHLGMTSQDVVCNADMEILFQSLSLVETKVYAVVATLCGQADTWKQLPALGFTHYQPAQPVTAGRRIALWASDANIARGYLKERVCSLLFKLRGLRGATGTQASYLALLDGRSVRVDELEVLFLHYMHEDGWGAKPLYSDEQVAEERKQAAEHVRWRLERQERYNTDVCERFKSTQPESAARDHVLNEMRSRSEASNQDEIHKAEKIEATSLTEYRQQLAFGYLSGRTFPLQGQTYPRVIDTFILADLASTAAVLHKIATDIRLLCNRKELDEPFEDKQIGSSAMPYKRNPMRCERICGLTRFVMNLVGNAYDTAATQWLERTLDDSSNRRLSLPEAFLALDGALDLMHNVASGLIVHEAMVKKNLMAELPFMATENIMMACVKLGGDRQHYHELIRVHAQAAGHRVKHEGLDNDLLDRLKADKNFHSKARGGPLSAELDWDGVMDPMKYIGRSVEQTERFIKEVVEPLREQYKDALANLGESGPKV